MSQTLLDRMQALYGALVSLMSEDDPVRRTMVRDWCGEVVRLAIDHDRLQVARCNRPLRESEDIRDAELEVLLPAAVARLAFCAGLALRLDLSGDPRGRTVLLYLPTDRSWSFGGEPGCFPV